MKRVENSVLFLISILWNSNNNNSKNTTFIKPNKTKKQTTVRIKTIAKTKTIVKIIVKTKIKVKTKVNTTIYSLPMTTCRKAKTTDPSKQPRYTNSKPNITNQNTKKMTK